MPLFSMPKKGTARNTQIASAVVVESEPVGASYHGKMMQILAVAINKNKVPIKPIYCSGWLSPISLISSLMVVTIISNMHCQREIWISVFSSRVINLDETTSSSLLAHVVTIVRLILIKPYCQKTVWSGLSFMAHFIF